MDDIPSVTLRQRVAAPALLNRKPPRPVTALQILEPIDRDPTGASRELQQSALLLGIPTPDDLPEVLDHLVRFRVAPVICMLLPVLHVDIRDTANEQFEFAFVKNVDEIRGNKLVEAGDEGIELLFHSFLDPPFRHKAWAVSKRNGIRDFGEVGSLLDVFLLVLVGDFYICTARLEFHFLHFPKAFICHRESKFHNIINVIVSVRSKLQITGPTRWFTYSVQVRLLKNCASTPSMSARETFFRRIIL